MDKKSKIGMKRKGNGNGSIVARSNGTYRWMMDVFQTEPLEGRKRIGRVCDTLEEAQHELNTALAHKTKMKLAHIEEKRIKAKNGGSVVEIMNKI